MCLWKSFRFETDRCSNYILALLVFFSGFISKINFYFKLKFYPEGSKEDSMMMTPTLDAAFCCYTFRFFIYMTTTSCLKKSRATTRERMVNQHCVIRTEICHISYFQNAQKWKYDFRRCVLFGFTMYQIWPHSSIHAPFNKIQNFNRYIKYLIIDTAIHSYCS